MTDNHSVLIDSRMIERKECFEMSSINNRVKNEVRFNSIGNETNEHRVFIQESIHPMFFHSFSHWMIEKIE